MDGDDRVKVDRADKEKRRIALFILEEKSEEERATDPEDYRRYITSGESPSLGSLGEAVKAKLAEKRNR